MAPDEPRGESAQHRQETGAPAKRPVRRAWYLLLLLPLVATLVPPFYARENPKLGAWPFFYWWQFVWIVLTALILAVVYRLTTRRGGQD